MSQHRSPSAFTTPIGETPEAYRGPGFAQLPDGRWTYTPGRKKVKLIGVILGALIVAFGIWWQAEPTSLVLSGGSAEAKVAWVSEERPGQDSVKLDTVKAVSDAYDPTRNATYFYHVVFDTPEKSGVVARLNYGQAVRPLHSIGDKVIIAYDRETPETVIDKWSVRTWAFGFFFMGVGLLLFIPQLFIFLRANRPIVLDPLTDYEDVLKATKS